MSKRLLLALFVAASIAVGALWTAPVLAQQTTVMSGLQSVGGTIALPDTDPRIIASRIINVALGVLGIIFLILIVYAGFLYMTSGGNPEKTERAIKLIRNGVIGLIIILCSWAIARYVIDKLIEAAGGGGNGGSTGSGPGGGGFTPSGGSTVLRVVGLSPNGTINNRKVLVKIVFSLPISDSAAANADAVIVTKTDGTRIPGTITHPSPNTLFFHPSTSCPAPNADKFCFDADTDFHARANDAVVVGRDGQPLRCGGFNPACDVTFHTGTEVDTTPPTVSMVSPLDGAAVPANSLVDLSAFASDNVAIGFVSFSDNGQVVGQDAPQGASPATFSARMRWDTAGIAAGQTRTITATAYDTDTGKTDSSPITVHVRAAHCFNGTQDSGETGIDCGGNISSADYCGACAGQACTVNSDCASGVCTGGVCVEQPIITSFNPNNGAVGSLVTINGYNFGSSGEVWFLGPAGATSVRAMPPQACVDAGVWQWGNRQVVIQVPVGAQNGPIRLKNLNSGLSADTNLPPATTPTDFIVNDTLRPGLCAIRPTSATPATPFTLYGTGFGTASGQVQFGTQTLTPAAWGTQTVQSSYPNVAVGSYDVSVNVAGMTSNPVTAQVTASEGGGTPQIAEITPPAGPIGQYITITGRNFGSGVGSVFFQNVASGQSVQADTTFPAACQTSFWHDTSIIVKVPKSLTSGGSPLPTGAYTVYVRTALPNTPDSNHVNFAVNTDPLAPGLCAISPRVGPIGTNVTLYGEHFGSSGQVVYSANVVGATAASWADGQITSRIPAAAHSGPVVVNVPVAGGSTTSSNPVLLEVRNCNESAGVCTKDEACCSDGVCHPPVCTGTSCTPAVCSAGPTPGVFAWQFSTGIIPRAPSVVVQCGQFDLPSPTPWSGRDGGNAACVNADIGMLFTTLLDQTTITDQTVHVFECTGSGSSPCATQTEVTKTMTVTPADGASGEGRNYVDAHPTTALKPSTTYQVVLTTGVRGLGAGGTFMDEDKKNCGVGNAYCFTFTTKNDATPCAVASVIVSPTKFTAQAQNETIPYAAVPRPADQCQVMACDPYDWRWSVSEARASITNVQQNSLGSCHQTATALMETVPGSPIQVRATEAASASVGAGDLSISFLKPEVVAYGPACKVACVNAQIWATFNIEMDPTNVAQNVEVRECAHEDCQSYTSTLPISPSNIKLTTVPNAGSDTRVRQLVIKPYGGTPERDLLEPGHFYRVILHGGSLNGFRSLSMAPLSQLNSPDGYTWTFSTRTGDGAVCVAERLDVSPKEKYASVIGDRQLFTATPFTKADECSTNGQAIYIESGYTWATSQPTVARYYFNGQLDTKSEIPAGCSDRCTPLGADGVNGKTARCGDNIVETTDPTYCAKYRANGGAKNCVTLAAGGSGGEECDGDAGCTSSCLWGPVAPFTCSGNSTIPQCMAQAGMGSCGNGRVDAKEDCDPGRMCTGTLPSSTTPPGSDCTDPVKAAECVTNHGTCVTATTRGCSNECRDLGSRAGGSTCGNSDISTGEQCDDGNLVSGDGCSADCLHEGSKSTIKSLCGNGIPEAGEVCESTNGVFPAGCDPITCLHTGTAPYDRANPSVPGCGNAVIDPGEDCDDGNAVSGDGCSAKCLYEGSSTKYRIPSVCGDGRRGLGESSICDAPPIAGDGRVDASQLAYIVGAAQPDAKGRMSSQLSATLQNVTGQATYGLQCGFKAESSCTVMNNGTSVYGLSGAGCCSLRPSITDSYPPNGDTDTCRNVLIHGSFNVLMDEASLKDNFLVARQVSGSACPSGETLVTLDGSRPVGGFKGFVTRIWQKIVAFFHAAPAHAQTFVWCKGAVTGTLTFTSGTRDEGGVAVPNTSFAFTLDRALDADTQYIVRFTGDSNLSDNSDPAKRVGIKSKDGVVSASDYSWTFTTGKDVCAVNNIRITDNTTDQPFLFTSANEAHPFTAYAEAIHNGKAVPISTTASYAWEWENWTASNVNIATFNPEQAPTPLSQLSADTRTVISTTVSGAAYVTARVHIIKDDMETPSTIGTIIAGAEKITALICEDPWPSRLSAPFTDAAGSAALAGTAFENGPYYNFGMMYCRDAGVAGPNEDIPSLVINPVPSNPTQRQQGVLREYLFTFEDPAQGHDAIGLRVMDNPRHLSISEWYASKGFTGSPAPLLVDGYQALREGRTVYVSAASTNGPGFPISSYVYVISYNDDANATTKKVFDALVQSMTFNTNLASGVSNACVDARGSVISDQNHRPVACSADWQCGAYGANLSCDNFKAKLQRDLVRIGDFQNMSKALESVKARDGKYPIIDAGSYLSGFTTSLWPSWKGSLEKTINAKSGSLPKDPVNRFVTCGKCTQGGTACTVDSDCPQKGDSCAPVDGYDAITCWNEQSRAYLCPMENGSLSSHLYTYRSVDQGVRYELAAEFEVPPPNAADPSQNWWTPPLFDEVKQCVTRDAAGRFCNTDADCQTCTSGNCANVPVVAGACRAVGGRYRYSNLCNGSANGESSTCGDGIIDSDPAHNKCLGGTKDGQSCQSDSDCSGGICTASEQCETKGPSATRMAACSTTGGASGLKQQVCYACRSYVDDTSHPGCFASLQCGNGRVDRGCNGDATQPCSTDADCSSGISCVALETCDDGKQNGTYGHCNLTCNGYDGYCGDGKVSLGEACDLGFSGSQQNGGYCTSGSTCNATNSCNLTCSGIGPRCGDGHVDAPQEECDGTPLVTSKAICSDNRTPCSSDADCPNSGRCGATIPACQPARVCGGNGGVCLISGGGLSGGGIDGKGGCRTDADCYSGATCVKTAGQICSSSYSGSVGNLGCGGALCGAQSVQTVRTLNCQGADAGAQACHYASAWGACMGAQFCGNGVVDQGEECDDGNADNTDGCTNFCKKNVCGDGSVYSGVEECDLGSQNGKSCSTAEYGSTCSNCSTSCKFQLTQGGFCGNGVIDSGSAEQCDTAGDTSAYVFAKNLSAARTCRALGYDYAISTVKASDGSTRDNITCSLSCAYGGCATCGTPPDKSMAANDPLFQGKIEGELYDTLFQQPIQNARVTLYYRGLQVAVTTSDDKGFFSFSNLDRHDGCNQYKLIIDSYGDNPKTTLFDESLRGGYMPIESPSFMPHENVATEATTAGRFTKVMIDWGDKTEQVSPDKLLRGYTIPRFNMLPKLKANEYIVQFWWKPFGGDIQSTIQDFQNNVIAASDGTAADQNAKASAYYAAHTNFLHDLVVRMPFTYIPGTFGRCSLTPPPVKYTGDGRNKGLDSNDKFIYKNPTPAYDPANPWAQFQWQPGVNGVDHASPVIGMASCTNKIRGTASRTCTGGKLPANLEGKLACSNNVDCQGTQADRSIYADSTCTGPVEPSRSGPLDVLSGAEGAYLFCYHPEWPIDNANRTQTSCTNFIVPPQSIFISGKGGQYDILVSAYQQFGSGSHNPGSIWRWLYDNQGKIQLFDQNGYVKTWNGTDFSGFRTNSPGAGWNQYDAVQGDMCLTESTRKDSNGKYLDWGTMTHLFFYGYTNIISTVWTPFSIDTSNKVVQEWNGGDTGADYRYFADLFTSEMFGFSGVGWGTCWERTCGATGFTYGDGTKGVFPKDFYTNGTFVCANGGNGYGSQFAGSCSGSGAPCIASSDCPSGQSCNGGDPACDVASEAQCPTGSHCASTANANVRCIQACTSDAQCTKGGFCGGVAGQCGSGDFSQSR